MIIDWISALLLLVGAAFSLLAAVGILRMPDFYSRLQVTTKASTLGVGCVVLGTALQLAAPGATTRALLVVAFLVLTSPVAAQVICWAARAEGVPMFEATIVDELESAEQGAMAGLEGASRATEDD